MPGVARLEDSSTSHGCYPGRKNCGASTDVFVNGRGVHRKDDPWLPHT